MARYNAIMWCVIGVIFTYTLITTSHEKDIDLELPYEKEVDELEFSNEAEDRKINWEDVKPSSMQAMTRRIHRVCQIIKWMDDTVAESLMFLIEEKGPEIIDHMRVYCMALNNLGEFVDEYSNITVHYGRSLIDRGPPKWIPAYFVPKDTFKSFNWTQTQLDQMYEMVDHAKVAYRKFATKLTEKIDKGNENNNCTICRNI